MAKLVREKFHDRRVFESQWIEFQDAGGRGYAQPDIFVCLDKITLCIECKLTQTPAALFQIADLYRPLLTKIYGAPVVGVVVCSRLVHDPGGWGIKSLDEALNCTTPDTWTMLWLGRL